MSLRLIGHKWLKHKLTGISSKLPLCQFVIGHDVESVMLNTDFGEVLLYKHRIKKKYFILEIPGTVLFSSN